MCRAKLGGVALLLTSIHTPSVHAHGLALPFAFWGNFSPAAARCQRVIAFEAQQCGNQMWKVHTDCFTELLDGKGCEETSVPLNVQQAHLNAENVVDLQCTSPEAQALGFLLKFEAQTDLNNFCTVLETELLTAVYGPVLTGDVASTTDATTRACVEATATATTRLLHFAVRSRRRLLDWIAANNVPPASKQALVSRSSAEIKQLKVSLEPLLEAQCAPTDFMRVYGRSDDALLQLIAERADCLSAAVYVESGITCPTPICGNGMQEPGEECDDGNTVSGDGCSSTCRLEIPAGS